ncbi:MAG TPA: alginate lyase family protein, partial [Arenibaculum sp.]|nr:alginate lyase family protein [Arenibaculum sp.]
AATATASFGGGPVIARPGVLLAGPAAAGSARCRLGDPLDTAGARPEPEPVAMLAAGDGYGGDASAEPFTWRVMTLASEAAAAGGGRPGRALVGLLRDWAEAGALTRIAATGPHASNTNVVRSLRHALVPLLESWSLVRPMAAAADRERIEGWLAHLVAMADVPTGTPAGRAKVGSCIGATYASAFPVSNCNNIGYHRDLVAMQWGILTGDDDLFRRGIERFRLALRQMRPDGSLPLETARGARALWYQGFAVGLLVHINELAARQGHDLHALGDGGRDLHAAVRFLLDAIDRPALVLAYAWENRDPGPHGDWTRQDLGFLVRRGHGRHYMAWAEAYLARFPGHPNAVRLDALIAHEPRPLLDETAGGNASCLHGGPPATG